MILSFINKIVMWYIARDFNPKSYSEIDKKLKDILSVCQNGLYIVHLKTSDSLFGRAISFFSGGNFSHTTIMLKCNYLTDFMSGENMAKVRKSIDDYYGKVTNVFDDNGCAFILISDMSKVGSICCSLSRYPDNRLIIQKLPTTIIDDKIIIEFLCNQIGRAYDTTGVLGFPVKKIFDDPKDYYCSELCYDACIQSGLKIAGKKDPSPFEIYQYCKYKFERIFGEYI